MDGYHKIVRVLGLSHHAVCLEGPNRPQDTCPGQKPKPAICGLKTIIDLKKNRYIFVILLIFFFMLLFYL